MKTPQGPTKGRDPFAQSKTTTQETKIEPKTLRPTGLDHKLLDADAVRAVERLQSRGFEAYLVGGCVRDFLLGRVPKDYDIATAARPTQVKRTFPRNCRIIGRRFKLAHLHFNQNRKILEVATFRTSPAPEGETADDLLITRDNEFGTAEEDAVRRDFTVNALFLDPIGDKILDFVGGLDDVDHRVLRTIGEPIVRFREDPVRIIRAAKFAGRLGFSLEQPTYEAMAEVAPDLSRAAPPRMLEEILRLLRGGHALESFQILRDIGALKVILPVIAEFLGEAPEQERVRFWRMLEALDHKVLGGTEVPNPVLLGVLFAAPVRTHALRERRRSSTTVAEHLIGPFAAELRLPRRDAGCLKRICGVQLRFTAHGPKRFKTASFLRDPYFREALILFELTCAATGEGMADLQRWKDLYREMRDDDPTAATDEPPTDEDRDQSQDADDERPARSSRRKRGRSKKRGARGAREEGARGDREEGARGDRDERPERPERAERDDGRAPAKKKTRTRKAAKSAGTRRRTRDDEGQEKTAGRGPKKKGAKAPRKPARKTSKRNSKPHRDHRVETIEPETFDVSAFDVELDPKRVPTFGTIVEGGGAKKKRKQIPRVPPGAGSEDYKPPPPPSDDPAPPPPPPPNDDEFGDW